MDKKTLVSFTIPIIVIIAYSEIFHVNIIHAILSIKLDFLLSFFLAYIGQILIVSYRDSLITNLDFYTSFKARFLGNAVSLAIPGAAGPDLSRAVTYVHKNVKLDKAFTLALYESFFDVNVGTALFLLLFWIKLSPLETILILIALGNILGWSSGLGYAYFTSGKLNRIEQKIFNIKYFKPLVESYMNLKDILRAKLKDKKITLYSIFLTALGYFLQSLPFYFLYKNLLFDYLINQTYLVATLVPIPSAAGIAELALSAILPPIYVIQVRILELVSYSLGFIYTKEIKLEVIKKEVKEIWKTS
ncbi:lysylphosphatidylglycerol synthase domain-containing protein [Sulfurisphaera javensis]|uniref:Lysylphosphatidylglycerol synthase domain-containing protein n=1 Tax=Sulfurisphaera javensis TaxID=2049879 RepID=A0AAT9GP19_9CREN